VVSVTDHGPGVPESERERVFERFQRGSHDNGQPGFGLGLAIGRELAERMGGSLTLEQPEAAGARFVLRLPAADPLTGAVTPAGASRTPRAAAGAPT
jgi:signal transduction histidine kinase